MRRGGWLVVVVVAVAALVIVGCESGDNGGDNAGDNGGNFDAARWDGTWIGGWDTENGGNGGAQVVVAVNQGEDTATVDIELMGVILGVDSPDEFQLNVDYDAAGATGDVTGTPLGDLNVNVDANDQITGSFTNTPAGIDRVEFTGERNDQGTAERDDDTITINYTVHFADATTATGTLTVTWHNV